MQCRRTKEKEIKKTETDLGGEVADDVGLVAAPERGGALLAEDAGEGVGDAPVGAREGAPAQHLRLVLQQQLDALHRRGPRLGHHGGRAAHGEVRRNARRRRPPLLLLPLVGRGGHHWMAAVGGGGAFGGKRRICFPPQSRSI